MRYFLEILTKELRTACSLILISLVCINCATGQSKTHIRLELLDSLFDTHHYTIKTLEHYGVDETIELYNVLDGAKLYLFSVLPDFKSGENWKVIDPATLSNKTFSGGELSALFSEKVMSTDYLEKKSLRYFLIKKETDQYFESNFCLSEFFFVGANYNSSFFNNPYGVINIGQEPLSVEKMMDIFRSEKDEMFRLPFPLDVRQPHTYLHNRWLLQREYLSKSFALKGDTAYQFWTLIDWQFHDGFNTQRGVDRFVYIPSKGIVGGSYDFYFLAPENWHWLRNNIKGFVLTREDLWSYVQQERIMLAEEFK